MNLGDYCSELYNWLPVKFHSEVYFVGGLLLNRQITDVDIFVYGTHESKIEMKLYDKFFSDDKKLDVLTSLSTDDFYNTDSENISLTEYILTQGLTKQVSGFKFKKLTNDGALLSKIAAFEQREDETFKDLPDIQILLKKFNFNISKNLLKVIRDFDLYDTFLKINKYIKINNYY